MCVFILYALFDAEAQPSAVKSQHAKMSPSMTCWSNEQSVQCVSVSLAVCVFVGFFFLACRMEVINQNEKAILAPCSLAYFSFVFRCPPLISLV